MCLIRFHKFISHNPLLPSQQDIYVYYEGHNAIRLPQTEVAEISDIDPEVEHLPSNELSSDASDGDEDKLHELSSDASDGDEDKLHEYHESLQTRLEQLAELLVKTRHNRKLTCFQYFQCSLIDQYLQMIHEEGLTRMDASKALADAQLHWRAGSEWKAKLIRRWSTYWCRYGQFPLSRRGKHKKTRSFIEDEDTQMRCMEWIRTQRGEITLRFA
jgi:hypothetical protein